MFHHPIHSGHYNPVQSLIGTLRLKKQNNPISPANGYHSHSYPNSLSPPTAPTLPFPPFIQVVRGMTPEQSAGVSPMDINSHYDQNSSSTPSSTSTSLSVLAPPSTLQYAPHPSSNYVPLEELRADPEPEGAAGLRRQPHRNAKPSRNSQGSDRNPETDQASTACRGNRLYVPEEKKPFGCPEPGCSARFAQLPSVKRHLRTVPKHRAGALPRGDLETCDLCGSASDNQSSFSRMDSLKRHKKSDKCLELRKKREGLTSST